MGSVAESDDDSVESLNETPIANFPPTRPRPSSSFPGENFGDASGSHCAQSTMPYDDNVAVEDALETQVLNFGGETQVLDDGVFLENMETQLIEEFTAESDGEATDKTEVLGCGDEPSDGESGRGGKCVSLDREKTQHTPPKFGDEGLLGQPNRSTNEHCSPGSVPRFTSVRAASLRASGLAARHIALKGKNCDSHSLLDNVQFLEDSNMKINGSETKVWDDKGSCHDDLSKLRGGKICKVGCSTVRKLFTEDSYVENELLPYSDDKAVGGKGAFQFLTHQDGLAGLSYVDSQEPGEFSQSNALACVQRLIDESKVLLDNELDHGKYSRGNSTCISGAKGPQSLAKKATDRGTVEKAGVFDWDDEQEDEGGGDIFCRKKEEFFCGEHFAQRSFTVLQKGRETLPDGCRDKEGNSNVPSEKSVHSDSRLLHNLKRNDKTAQETEINTRRNLVCEFIEQSNIDASAGPLEATLSSKDVLNVGLDTQLAAEAMEALFHGEGLANYDANDGQLGQRSYDRSKTKKKGRSGQCSYDRSNHAGLATRNSKKSKKLSVKSSKSSAVSLQKLPEDVRKSSDTGLVMTRSKRAKIDAEKPSTTYGSMKESRKLGGAIEDSQCDEFNTLKGNALKAGFSLKKRQLPDELAAFTPTGCRRRQSLAVSQFKSIDNVLGNGKEMASLHSEEPGNHNENLTTMSNGIRCPKGRRSCQNSSRQCKAPDNLDCQSKLSSRPGKIGKSVTGNKRSEGSARTDIADSNKNRKTKSFSPASPYMPTMQRNSGEQLQQGAGNPCSNADNNGHKLNENRSEDGMLAKAMTFADKRNGADSFLSTENEENPQLDKSREDTTKSFESACTSPANCKTSVNDVSPVCVGNGYSKISCKKNMSRSSLMRELSSLCATGLEPISPPKDLRKRRDLASVRVLFSQHLDEDTLKHQRKIVDRLKISVASYIMEATHFISDKFVRTRNMLEAIASGKPVVTHLWLENVGQANFYIDEEKFVLRDTKKEKEFGFNMAVSLAHARQHPLLQGKRVLITPNARPGKETILSLVKAVHGKAVQRVGKSALKDDTFPDDLLVLSCEEDYEACVPFLERGAAVYSSELLLNGIVIQKLEYERHRLFVDKVKRTRSTVWLKKDGCSFIPVPKHK